MFLAHGASSGLGMFASGGFILLVTLVLIGAVVVGRMTRHDHTQAPRRRSSDGAAPPDVPGSGASWWGSGEIRNGNGPGRSLSRSAVPDGYDEKENTDEADRGGRGTDRVVSDAGGM